MLVNKRQLPADYTIHSVEFSTRIERSSWVAIRQFPQLHTNPVNVIIDEQPVRASRNSELWCAEMTKLLWMNRRSRIADHERSEAEETFQRAIRRYEQIVRECPAESSGCYLVIACGMAYHSHFADCPDPREVSRRVQTRPSRCTELPLPSR
ncbi:MAG TPA: hypothetical protein P5307_25390 [Pirellulaceae bacterium]|nr:hypothetical protein [Pirellulaceae bacterium]